MHRSPGSVRPRPPKSQLPYCARTAAVRAFSVTSHVTQRDGVAGARTCWEAAPCCAPATGNALAGSAATFRGPDRLPKPGSLDAAGLAPFRLPGITPGLQASGRQPAIQETSSSSCSTGASWPGLPAHPLRRDPRSALP